VSQPFPDFRELELGILQLDFGALLNSTFRLGSNFRSVNFIVDNSPLRAVLPEDSVFFSIKDILLNREYEFFPQFELTRPRQIVVDAGAHAGLYTLIASLWAKKVFALEPDSNIFQMLNSNIARNSLTNVIPKKSALWIEDGQIRFYRRGNSQLGTVMRCKNSQPILVNAVSLKHLLDETLEDLGGRAIDLLKLDIEGAEFDVIPSADRETLERVSRIVAEIHTVHGKTRVLTNKLKQCGFSYVVVKRPFRKAGDKQFRILADYKLKLLLRAVNMVMGISNYSDWSSLLLFASREGGDFPDSRLSSLKGKIVETSIE
jgi:FkbM family methyltransferase